MTSQPTAARPWPPGMAHPFAPDGRRNPFPAFRWLRAESPVHYDPFMRFWLLSRHADCAAALRDPAFSAALGQDQRQRDDQLPASMLSTDPPEHDRLRGPGMALLGPAAVRALAGDLEEEADRLLDGLEAGPGGEIDAHRDLGEPYARAVLARALGLPRAEWEAFGQLAGAVSVNLDPLGGPAAIQASRLARTELARLLGAAPAVRPAELTRAELLEMLSLVVIGGYEPLAVLIGNTLFCLLSRPRLAERVRLGDTALASTAVEEVTRLHGPIPFTARVTTAAAELPGGVIPPGARVLALLSSANRDELVFDRPDEPVIDRSPNPHLAYSSGPHFCLGAALVRQAAALLVPAFLRRFPGARLPPEDAGWAASLVPRRRVSYGLRLA